MKTLYPSSLSTVALCIGLAASGLTAQAQTTTRKPTVNKAVTHASLPAGSLNKAGGGGTDPLSPCDLISASGNASNLLVNSDFDHQIHAPRTASNVLSPDPSIPADLADWRSGNCGSPEYYATNAENTTQGAQVNPATGVWGPFTPHNYSSTGFNGSAGVGTVLNNGVTGIEYIRQDIQPLQAGDAYYARFYAYRGQRGDMAYRLGMNVTKDGDAQSPGSVTCPGPLNQNQYYLPVSTGIISASPITAASLNTDNDGWTKVFGAFVATGGETHVVIGPMDPASATAGLCTTSGPNPQPYCFAGFSYYQLDDVVLVPLPKAARQVCIAQGQTTLTLPTVNCPITDVPLTYHWTYPNGNTSSLLNPVINNVATDPDTWGTYELTVTLPNGTTAVSSLEVYGPLVIQGRLFGNQTAPLVQGQYVCQARYVTLNLYGGGPFTNVQWTLESPIAPPNPGAYTGFITSAGLTANLQQTPSMYRFQPGVPVCSPSIGCGPTTSYVIRCTATNPCGKQVSTTFQFYSMLRDASCGEEERPVGTIKAETSAVLPAYPVPTDALLTVPVATPGTVACLYNSQGHPVRQATAADAHAQLSTADLPNGLYLLRTTEPDGKVAEQRILVSH